MGLLQIVIDRMFVQSPSFCFFFQKGLRFPKGTKKVQKNRSSWLRKTLHLSGQVNYCCNGPGTTNRIQPLGQTLAYSQESINTHSPCKTNKKEGCKFNPRCTLRLTPSVLLVQNLNQKHINADVCCLSLGRSAGNKSSAPFPHPYCVSQ